MCFTLCRDKSCVPCFWIDPPPTFIVPVDVNPANVGVEEVVKCWPVLNANCVSPIESAVIPTVAVLAAIAVVIPVPPAIVNACPLVTSLPDTLLSPAIFTLLKLSALAAIPSNFVPSVDIFLPSTVPPTVILFVTVIASVKTSLNLKQD